MSIEIQLNEKRHVTTLHKYTDSLSYMLYGILDYVSFPPSRVKKLKDTFAFIQQLDRNMSHLHMWLARIESELSKPIVYDICDDQEIQRRLAEQQVGWKKVELKEFGSCLSRLVFLGSSPSLYICVIYSYFQEFGNVFIIWISCIVFSNGSVQFSSTFVYYRGWSAHLGLVPYSFVLLL